MATSFSGGGSRSTRTTTDHGQVTCKLYHLRLRVECILFCNLQSRARTHAVLVICLYELLGNPTTKLIVPPGPWIFIRVSNLLIISWREHVTFRWDDDDDGDDVCFLPDQRAKLDCYSKSFSKQQSTRTHYPDSVPTSLCSFPLMLHYHTRDEHANHCTTDAVKVQSSN